MKRFIALLGSFTLLLGISFFPTFAQTPEWEAWMYNSNNGRMVLIGSDNIIYDDLTLPGLQGNDYSWNVMVSPDGRTIVYSLNNTFNGLQTINVYNTNTDSIIATYMIPSQQGQLVYSSVDLNPTTQAFSPDGQTLAIGYTIEQNWTLVILDLVNQPGSVLAQINSTDPNMSGIQQIALDVPTPVRYDGLNVDFLIIQAATEGSYTYPQYTYNRSANTVAQNYYLTAPGGDFNDRDGRYVVSMSDFRLPNNNQAYQGFGRQVNALHMWSPNTTETFPIFNAPDHSLSGADFVQNGEKILMFAFDWVAGTSTWWTIEQANMNPTVITPLADNFPSGMEGVGDGFLISINTNNIMASIPALQNLPNRTALLYFNTRAAADGSVIEQKWFGGENQGFKLVWARDNQLNTRPLVPQWTPIGDPANASNYNSLTDVGVPIVQGVLQIGGQARIFTTEGDRANMRSGPGTNFAVVEQLANDTIVAVLEGPQQAGDFTWWRVQSAGNTGWVVESADGIRVLQPFGVLVAPTIDPTSTAPQTLAVGGFAVVTTDGNNLNARRQPSTNANVVKILRTSERVSIIGGPTRAEGFIWWQVRTEQGTAWVAEGTADERWIIASR